MIPARGAGLGDSEVALVSAYDAGLFDLDGVVYRGTAPIAHAAETIAAVSAAGMRVMFVTNNASRTPEQVVGVLDGVGVTATEDDVVTSAQAAARVLREMCAEGGPVLVVGGDGLRQAVRDAGFTVVGSADDSPVAVVQGFAADTTYDHLAEATLAVHAGAVWIASNADSTIPTPRGLLPGNGALVAAVAAATGARPLIAGKPDGALHAESVRRSGARRPLVVGDRLDTDIEGAVGGDTDSLLVLTGVVGVAELLAAPVGSRPTFVAADLRGLLESQPPVDVSGSTASCAGISGVVAGDEIELSGTGTPTAALRVACRLAWAAVDGGANPPTRLSGPPAAALGA